MQRLETEFVGTREAVRAALRAARVRGQLVRFEHLPARPGMAAVRVVLQDQALAGATPARSPRRRGRRPAPRRVWVLVGAAAGVLALVVVGVVYVALWVMANWQLILGCIALAVVLAVLLVAAGLGGGKDHSSGHCSGPNTGHR